MVSGSFEDYRLLHAEVVRTIGAMSPGDLQLVCRGCPDWTVRQVVGHMVHTLGSSEADRLPRGPIRDAVMGVDEQARRAGARARDEWTGRGARSFDALPLDELLSKWELLVAAEPEVGLLLIPDVAVHLADIAETVGIQGGDRRHVLLGLGPYSSMHAAAFRARGLPGVRLHCTDGGESFGDLESDLVVSGRAYDLCRVVMGRRTPLEADATINWGHCSPEVRHNFPLYGLETWRAAR